MELKTIKVTKEELEVIKRMRSVRRANETRSRLALEVLKIACAVLEYEITTGEAVEDQMFVDLFYREGSPFDFAKLNNFVNEVVEKLETLVGDAPVETFEETFVDITLPGIYRASAFLQESLIEVHKRSDATVYLSSYGAYGWNISGKGNQRITRNTPTETISRLLDSMLDQESPSEDEGEANE